MRCNVLRLLSTAMRRAGNTSHSLSEFCLTLLLLATAQFLLTCERHRPFKPTSGTLPALRVAEAALVASKLQADKSRLGYL